MANEHADDFTKAKEHLKEVILSLIKDIKHPMLTTKAMGIGISLESNIEHLLFKRQVRVIEEPLFVEGKMDLPAKKEFNMLPVLRESDWERIFLAMQKIDATAVYSAQIYSMNLCFENCARLLCGQFGSKARLHDLLARAKKQNPAVFLSENDEKAFALKVFQLVHSKTCSICSIEDEEEIKYLYRVPNMQIFRSQVTLSTND
ncbi:MAG: hypothetical protein KA028_01265 [Candidatus Pacebacteria bacterium]|nr:hypothetical protein [Candidatus Paceibacterota bacterium]MBP9851860.1 hypothetical protein [Candidatus Paceibacterota bacterium]